LPRIGPFERHNSSRDELWRSRIRPPATGQVGSLCGVTTSTVAPLALPASDDEWGSWLRSRCDEQLAVARATAADLVAAPPSTGIERLRRWNEVGIALANAMAAASLLPELHPDEAIRTQAETAGQDAHRLATELSLDRGLYDVLAGVDASELDEGAARVLALALRDFRRAGVDRDEATRQRLREINERETLLGQQFARAIRDDTRHVKVEPERLAGLPDDFLAAHAPGDDGLVTITTEYPDAFPVLTFASDREVRRQVMYELRNKAWPENDAVLRELLDLRAEHASLLGYDGWPDYDAEVKMIGAGKDIAEFIDRIADVADEPAHRDLDVLLERVRRDHPDASGVSTADHRYYSELVRREQFDVDAQEVRTYFDFDKVCAGLLDVTGELFGLTYTATADPPSWHPDVQVYDVAVDGQPLGRIYLDLHPRPGKFSHAAMFDLVPGIAGRQLPEGVLACNFSRGLMEHDDVVTLFHEFGHLVHHLLAGRHEWARFSGINTEWDFVEAPSQMLEEWAWDPAVLRRFATDAAGDPIAEDLVEKMRAADDFGKGVQARRQMSFAAISYNLHQHHHDDLTTAVGALRARYDLTEPIEDTHMHTSFGHLDGYSSGYYTYMWSLVIAKDLFSAFDRDDLLAHGPARRYRDEILAAGGSGDAADLVAKFLGRPYNFDAFQRWIETAPAA
jgi:thimet oligopeptidase